MIIDIILLSLGFIALIIGTITDIKTREVPDWVNFGLIFAGIGIRLVYSSITFDWMFLTYGLYGLFAAVIIGYIMFYAGQWGGGDAKLLMGLGAVIGLPLKEIPIINSLLFIFLINILIFGAIYGLIYGFVLAIIHRKKFIVNFKKIIHNKKIIKIRKIGLIVSIILIVLFLFIIKETSILILLILLITLIYISSYLMMFVKAVELSAMYKNIEPEELTEGDWIAKDIVIDKKRITGPKDLGITRKQINQLIAFKKQNKINKIKIKQGIPFVPSFLVAFIISLIFGGWWMIFF